MTFNPRLEKLCVGIFVLSLLGGAIVVMSFFELPAANRDVVFQLVGGINALAGLVVGGYFRSHNEGHVTVDNAPSDPVPTRSADLPEPTFGKDE